MSPLCKSGRVDLPEKMKFYPLFVIVCVSYLTECTKIEQVSFKDVMHLNCELPSNISNYQMATFRIFKDGNYKKAVSHCRLVTTFRNSICDLDNENPANSWGTHFEGNGLTAIEFIREIKSPNDRGKYECKTEMWDPNKTS